MEGRVGSVSDPLAPGLLGLNKALDHIKDFVEIDLDAPDHCGACRDGVYILLSQLDGQSQE